MMAGGGLREISGSGDGRNSETNSIPFCLRNRLTHGLPVPMGEYVRNRESINSGARAARERQQNIESGRIVLGHC